MVIMCINHNKATYFRELKVYIHHPGQFMHTWINSENVVNTIGPSTISDHGILLHFMIIYTKVEGNN